MKKEPTVSKESQISFAHFINLIFLTLLIRSGIEILSALPKFYWHDNATPGTEWIRFTKKGFLLT